MADVVAFESNVQTVPGFLAAADLSSYQYYAVKLSAGKVAACDTLGETAFGILQNAPSAAEQACSVAYGGIGKAKIGGTVSQLDRLVADVDAMLINQTDPDEVVVALALSDGSDGDVIPVIYVTGPTMNSAVVGRSLANTKFWIGDSSGEAQAFALSGDGTCTAGGVLTVTDVTVGSDATGDLLYKSSATALARLAKGTAAQLLAMNSGATAPEWISQSAIAVTDIGTTAAGDAIGDLIYRDAAATFERLAVGTASQILQVNAGATAPEWNSLSGDATLTAGVITIANDAVGAAKMGSTVAGSDGCIFKSSSTPDAVAELDVPRGNVVVGSAADVTILDMGASAGNIMVDDGTDPASVAVSADATLAASGALTLAKGFMRPITTNWTAAEVKAGDATPLVLADFSALVGLGVAASGDALIFHHLIANISGGAANYDQNENSIIKYQTAGGGATLSLTLANWFNGAGADSLTDIKQLATVVVPDVDEDIVWTMSASPYNAAGDRLLRVTLYYSVFTPA